MFFQPSLHLRAVALLLFLFILLQSCGNGVHYEDRDVPSVWADMTLKLSKETPGNSPTYASRCLGYIGLTMYECMVPDY
ncbi:MAG: hypothetical protein ACJAX1_001044, partial [Neolewinella sp.]